MSDDEDLLLVILRKDHNLTFSFFEIDNLFHYYNIPDFDIDFNVFYSNEEVYFFVLNDKIYLFLKEYNVFTN